MTSLTKTIGNVLHRTNETLLALIEKPMFDKCWLCLILDNNWTALSLYTSADGYVGLYVLMGAPVFENK